MPDASSLAPLCRRLLDRALTWTSGHLPGFDPFPGGATYDLNLGQRVGELAILVQVYVRLTGDRTSPRLRRMADTLARMQARRAFSDRMLRRPVEFVLFAQVYSTLRTLGIAPAGQRALIRRVLASGFLDHTERIPYRSMELVACLESAGIPHPYPTLHALYRTSILQRVPNPLFLDEDGLYAVTHVLMYLHGIGTRARPAVPAGERPALIDSLAAQIVIAAQEHHWDLLAELLLCWECLSFPPEHIVLKGWQALAARQDGQGGIPGPEWAQALYDESVRTKPARPLASRRDFYFSHHYHTTLVSALAACVCLHRRGPRS